MAPSNPKRPPRPPRPPGASASKKEDAELPFDDDEVAPLQEDDPRPQRVPQFPAGPRRPGTGQRSAREASRDRELFTRFDANEYSDPGYVPAFLYVEKGPGVGQLIPVKQGPLVIGRASICDLRLQHPSISRRHAQLMRQGDRFLLRDLGSQNGTFVNRVKISSDHEVLVGDEISVGNAVLRLRGSGMAQDTVSQTPAPARKAPRKGTSLARVALTAAAVGSAVAALLTVAFLKFVKPSLSAPISEQLPTDENAVAPTDAPMEEAEAAYIPPASDEESAAAMAESAKSPALAEEKAEEPGPRPRVQGGKKSARQEASSEPSRPAAHVDPADVILLYEKGEVDEALALARRGQLESLVTKLVEFQSAMAAGRQALQARNTTGAIQHYSTALALDQELAQGWGNQAPKLRKQLGKLYTQLGQSQLKAGSKDAARESFELALEYDPSNTWAKTEFQALGGKKKKK